MKQIKETELLIKEQNLVEKRVVFNSRKCCIQKGDYFEVVVCDDAGVRRLKKIETYVLQPHKYFNPCMVYFIKNYSQSGTWGGHVRWGLQDDEEVESSVIINLRMNFFFSIIRGDRFVILFDSDKSIYDKRYILEKLRNKIGVFVKNYVLQFIHDNSVADLFKSGRELALMLEQKINEQVLYEYGVVFENLNLITEKVN